MGIIRLKKPPSRAVFLYQHLTSYTHLIRVGKVARHYLLSSRSATFTPCTSYLANPENTANDGKLCNPVKKKDFVSNTGFF